MAKDVCSQLEVERLAYRMTRHGESCRKHRFRPIAFVRDRIAALRSGIRSAIEASIMLAMNIVGRRYLPSLDSSGRVSLPFVVVLVRCFGRSAPFRDGRCGFNCSSPTFPPSELAFLRCVDPMARRTLDESAFDLVRAKWIARLLPGSQRDGRDGIALGF